MALAKEDAQTIQLCYDDRGSAYQGKLQHLGKLFYKGPGSQGQGIGLYLIKNLMERMGGKLDIVSFSSFSFLFNLEKIWQRRQLQRGNTSMSQCSILIVEDEPNLGRTLCEYMEAKGHPAVLALCARRARDLFRQNAPSVVLMDVQLPTAMGLSWPEVFVWSARTLPCSFFRPKMTLLLDSKA